MHDGDARMNPIDDLWAERSELASKSVLGTITGDELTRFNELELVLDAYEEASLLVAHARLVKCDSPPCLGCHLLRQRAERE